MKKLFVALTFLVSLQSFAQTDSTKAKQDTISDQIFMRVVIVASIDQKTWMDYLNKAITPYKEIARHNGIPDGTYSVSVRFLVEADGSIVGANALNNPGYGLVTGAVKIMMNSPKWNPSIENGRKVRSYRTQVITFVFP